MPADDCLGLDDVKGSSPVGPEAAKNVPERTISPAEGWSATIALQNFNLMTEREVLSNERLAGLEQREQRLQS